MALIVVYNHVGHIHILVFFVQLSTLTLNHKLITYSDKGTRLISCPLYLILSLSSVIVFETHLPIDESDQISLQKVYLFPRLCLFKRIIVKNGMLLYFLFRLDSLPNFLFFPLMMYLSNYIEIFQHLNKVYLVSMLILGLVYII